MLRKKRKTVLFVLHSAHRTGASIYAEKIISYFVSHNKECQVGVLFAGHGELLERFQELDVLLLSAGQKVYSGSGVLKLVCRLVYYIRFARVLFSLRPDIVYSNTIVNNGEVVISKLFRAKTIVHSHEGYKMAQRLGYKVRLSNIFTDKYIAVSNYAADVIATLVHRQSVVIHSGVDVGGHLNISSQNAQIKTVGIIGSIDRNKGHLLAVKALDILVNEKKIDISIKIVGAINDIAYYEEIKNYCIVRGLGNKVIFAGSLAGVNEIYAGIDCVVSASFDEAFPLVSLESMALGVLLIASDTGGNKELVEDGVTGMLFPVGDHIALAERIFVACNNSQLSRKIASKAMTEVSDRFCLAEKLELIAKQLSVA